MFAGMKLELIGIELLFRTSTFEEGDDQSVSTFSSTIRLVYSF